MARICEHLGISALTGKIVKGDDDSGIKEYLLFLNQAPYFKDFSILATINDDFKVTITLLWIRTSNPYLWNFLTAKEQSFIIW